MPVKPPHAVPLPDRQQRAASGHSFILFCSGMQQDASQTFPWCPTSSSRAACRRPGILERLYSLLSPSVEVPSPAATGEFWAAYRSAHSRAGIISDSPMASLQKMHLVPQFFSQIFFSTCSIHRQTIGIISFFFFFT